MTNFKPPFLLKGLIIDAAVNGEMDSLYMVPDDDPTSWLNYYPTEWILSCYVTNPQMHSADGLEYNATHVEVGDWLASNDGKAVQIIELLPLLPHQSSYNTFRCRTKDIDNYLMLSDPSQSGQSIGSIDHFFCFKADEDGFPIMDGAIPYDMDVTAITNIMSRFSKQNKTKIWVSKDGGEPLHTNKIDFVGSNWRVTDDGDSVTKVEFVGGDGGSNITIKDNGNEILTNPTEIDFGTGLDVTVDGSAITINATPALNVQKDGSDVGTATTINFNGDNITVDAETNLVNVSVRQTPVLNNGSEIVANPDGLDFSTDFTITQEGDTARISVNTDVVQNKIDIMDDGIEQISNPTSIDFGNGLQVTVEDSGIKVDVDNTIVQSTISVKDDSVEIVNNPPTLNFGNGLRVTREGDNDARIDVDIADIPPSIDIQDDGTSIITSPSILNFGDGLTVTNEDGGALIALERLEVDHDGTKIAAPKAINFIGSGVSVSANGDSVDVSVLGSNKLEEPQDGSLTPGAITDWETGVTTYSTALDDLNEVLAKLLPPRPASLSTKALSIKGAYNVRNGVNVLLAENATNNVPGLTPVFGTQTIVVFGTTIESNDVVGFGSGNSGTLTVRINGQDSGTTNLTNGNDTGTYSNLVITSDTDYPTTTPGFWQALTAKISSVGVTGINRYEMKHTDGGDATPVTFVRDNKNVAPTINNIDVSEGTANLVYSSGVPHYTANSTVLLGGSVDNLVGQTYLASKNIVCSTSRNIGSATLSCGQFGLATVPTANLPTFAFTGLPLTLTGTAHTTTTVSAIAANSYADSAPLAATKQINYLSGTASVIMEGLQIITGGQMKRVAMANGDRPATTYATFASATWNAGNASSQGDAANAWEAVVRGGVVRNDQTNYSDGSWLPVGPDYSGKATDQYICFVIQKITSSIKITFTGSDPAGLWIKLPDVATNDSKPMPNATNGWWDAKKQLNFPAGSYPGSSGSNDGCLRAKTGLLYDCSFGVVSSAAATDNQIYIRIKLAAGQSLSNITLSF